MLTMLANPAGNKGFNMSRQVTPLYGSMLLGELSVLSNQQVGGSINITTRCLDGGSVISADGPADNAGTGGGGGGRIYSLWRRVL